MGVAHALIRTVHDLNANDWSTTLGSAWISYFLWIQPHLLAGARDAAARETTAREAAAREAAAEPPPPSRRPPASPPFPEATPRSSTTSTSSG